MGSNSYIVSCFSGKKEQYDCHVIRAKGFREVRTWAFESFSEKYHKSEGFAALLGNKS
jgi:hypothetical protein